MFLVQAWAIDTNISELLANAAQRATTPPTLFELQYESFEMSAREGIAVYSAFCGTDNNAANVVSPAYGVPSFYITDNNSTRARAELAGWKTISLSGNPDADILVANMKCKLPRTLPHLFYPLDTYRYLVHCDSKKISGTPEAQIMEQIDLMKQNSSIVMVFNRHPFASNVWEEVEVAMQDMRYKVDETRYREYLARRFRGGHSISDHLAGGFVIRDMDSPMTLIIGSRWYSEILQSGIEDQISLPLIYYHYRKWIGLTSRWTPG